MISVVIGSTVCPFGNVKVQNNVAIYTGTVIEDDVFLGPSCVLTNVTNPRSQVNRHSLYEKTLLRRGCTIGANATIVCGITIGRYAFIAAGSVVAKDVGDYALMMGVPGKQVGWMSRHACVPKRRTTACPPQRILSGRRACRHGHKLTFDERGNGVCPESGLRYERKDGFVCCVDLSEDVSLPEDLKMGKESYDEFKISSAR